MGSVSAFIAEAENGILLDPAGIGKSHRTVGLGNKAVSTVMSAPRVFSSTSSVAWACPEPVLKVLSLPVPP